MNSVVQTLESQPFIQAILLLIFTAILVPVVKLLIDLQGLKQQKRLERQEKLIEYETKLLDDIDKLVWEYWILVKMPAYFAKSNNKEEYDDAVRNYSKRAPILFGELRALLSRTCRLATPLVYDIFSGLYDELGDVDKKHLALCMKLGSESLLDNQVVWEVHFKSIYNDTANKIDSTLSILAQDFGLVEKKSRQEQKHIAPAHESSGTSLPTEKGERSGSQIAAK